MWWFVLLFTLLDGSLLCWSEETQKIPLLFSYITTKTGSYVTAGAVPMVDLALELINNRTDILANYSLTYNNTIGDSKCDRTASLEAFMDQFRGVSNPTYVSLLCCGCATSTIPVAEISHFWNIPQIAGVASAHELNDRKRFSGFFQTDATTEYIGPALQALAQEFNWSQVAIITQGGPPFQQITDSISAAFKSDQRLLDTSATFQKTDNPIRYNQLFDWNIDFRVIIINSDDLHIYEVLCEAYHRNMRPPKYVWITKGWHVRKWWTRVIGNTSCNTTIIERMLDRSLTYNPNGNLVSDDKNVATFSGLTPDQYNIEYARRLQLDRYKNLIPNAVSGSVFDATWSMALSLQLTLKSVAQNNSNGCDHLPGKLVPLEHFDYMNEKMGCVMRRSYSRVSFQGITGGVSFNSNGSRDIRTVRIQQYRMSLTGIMDYLHTEPVIEVVVGENGNKLAFKRNNTLSTIWPNGIPYDGSAREVMHPNHPALISTYALLAIVGLVYAFACLIFNTVFRNRKVVKLSSPNLNFALVAGVILLYVSVFLYLYSPTNIDQASATIQTIFCNLRQWLSSTGYTLCLSVVLAKTWRIYYIFASPLPIKTYSRDWFLYLIILTLLSADIVILFLGTAIPQSRFNATLASDLQHPKAVVDGFNYNYNVYVCLNSGTVTWLVILYIYKGLLQLAAMLMAFHIRRVKIKVFNDSKEIAIAIYLNCITLLLLAVVEFTLSAYHEAYAALFGAGMIVGATLFLTLVFIPRMVHLYKDPQGTTVLDEDEQSVPKLPSHTEQPIYLDKNELVRLRQRVAVLERAQSEKAQSDQVTVKFELSSALEASDSASGVSL